MVEVLKVAGKSIIDYVTSITSEQCIEDDSCVNIELSTTIFSNELDFIVKGSRLELVFSAYNGFTSKRIISTVQEVSKSLTRTEYKVSIKSLNVGTTLKNNTSKKVYTNTTLADIVRYIANTHGLIPVINSTSTKVWERVPQSNRSDFALLQYLVVRDGGNDVIYCDNDSIYFTPIGTSTNSGGIFDLLADNNELISLKSQYKTYSKNRKSTNISTSASQGGIESYVSSIFGSSETTKQKESYGTYDAYTGKTVNVPSTFFTADYNKLKAKLPIQPTESNSNASKAANTTNISSEVVPNVEELNGASLLTSSSTNEAASITSSAKNKIRYIELEVNIVGNPKLKQNTYIQLKNIGNGFDGRWFVDKISDNITAQSYTTTLTLTKIGHIYKDKNDTDTNKEEKSILDKAKDGVVNTVNSAFNTKDPRDRYSGYTGKTVETPHTGFTEKGNRLKAKVLPNSTNISSNGTSYSNKNIKQ